MTSPRSRFALIACTSGAGLLAVSVFLPWYSVSSAHGLAGAPVRSLTAHHALSELSVILVVLAWLALLDALLALASATGGAGASVVVFGALASACVAYRMLQPPAPADGGVVLSLQSGAWLALLGAVTMTLASVWPRVSLAPPRLPGARPGFSGTLAP